MSEYNRIKFSLFWDKLQDPEFTSIRPWSEDKENYFRSHIGEKFTVLKVENYYQRNPGRSIGLVYLKGVIQLDPRQLPTDLLRRDVSLEGKINQVWFDKISRMEKALLLVFSKEPIRLIPKTRSLEEVYS